MTPQLKDEMPSLNGLAFSPNEKYLYLNGGGDNYVNRYDVLPDGTMDMRRNSEPGVAVGMRVDIEGNVYETGPGGIWIVSPAGKHLGTITPPQRCINLAFGDADRKTLYMASHTAIYKVRVEVPGR